jgi:high frequency lysogenization protein
MTKLQSQTLALAAILQNTALITQLAKTGSCDIKTSTLSFESLKINSIQVTEVFKTSDLSLGIEMLKNLLGNNPRAASDAALYAFSLIKLKKNILKNPQIKQTFFQEINRINTHQFFKITDPQIRLQLAELYKNIANEFGLKLMLNGKKIHLSNDATITHIRALLICALRSVSLWRAQNGKIWQLLLNKKKMLNYINTL